MLDINKVFENKIGEDVVNSLKGSTFNTLTPVLVNVFRDKSKEITPTQLLKEYEDRYDFYGTASITQKEMLKFRQLWADSLPEDFEMVELSPITPFGACVALTELSQDVRMTTIKKSEVVSDSTIALSLEASKRRKGLMKKADTMFNSVNLATSHRLLRLQAFDKKKGFLQHFGIFGTITAGRGKGKNTFILDTILRHVELWLNFILELQNNGYLFKDIKVAFNFVPLMEYILNYYNIDRNVINKNSLIDNFDYFKDYNINIAKSLESAKNINDIFEREEDYKNIASKLNKLDELVINVLREKYPQVSFYYEMDRKLGLGYFSGYCFHIFAKNKKGIEVPLVDGGVIDWTKLLLSDKLELAVTSSFGSELGQNSFIK